MFVGRKAAIVSSTAIDPAGFALLAERAVAMARVVPDDPYSGLADTAAPPEPVALDLDDPAEPDAAALAARAAAAEEAALAVHGVTNSEGADAGFGRTEALLVTSAGFAGRAVRTSHSVSATALAGTRDRDAARLRLPFHRPPGGPGRPGKDRPQRRRTRGRPAEPGPAEDREAAGRL